MLYQRESTLLSNLFSASRGTRFGYVAAVAENDDNSSCGKHGVLRSAIWNVDPDTNRTLRAIWAGPGRK